MTAIPLWALTNELEDIFAQLLDSEGELTPELEKRLDEAQVSFSEKIESTALKRRSLELEADMIKQEEARLAKRRRSLEKKAEWLNDYILRSMERAKTPKAGGVRIKARLCDNPRPVIIWRGTPDQIPLELRKPPAPPPPPAPPELDKERIEQLWRANEKKLPDTIPSEIEIIVPHHVRYD